MNDCVFCKIASGEIKSEIIYENDNFFSVFDQNQEIPGHALVISKKHFATTLDMPATIGAEFLDCIKKTAIKIIDEQKAEGFNIINNNFEAAGQAVKHVHYHIIPRKRGDKVPRVY